MADPLKATFFSFRKREGGVLLAASLAFAFLALLLWGSFLYLNSGALLGGAAWFIEFVSVMDAAGGNVSYEDMPEFPSGLLAALGGALLATIAYNILLAAYESGCLRWLIRGERSGLFGLSLGADTWRVWGIYWVWFGYNIVVALVTAVAVGALALMAGENWSESAASWAELAIQVFLIYFVVRLAPAAATSVGRGAFSFFEAWRVSRDRFWALLGSFVLLGLLVLAACVLIFGGAAWLMWPSIGGDIAAAIEDPDNAELGVALITKLFSGANLFILGGAYLALAPVTLLMLLTYYGICARAVLAALEEGKIEREEAS